MKQFQRQVIVWYVEMNLQHVNLNYVKSCCIFSIKLLNACMQPTENYGNACSLTLSPFINDCDYPGAYSALNWLYNGTLMEPDDGIAPTEVRHQTIRTFAKISTSIENNGQMF